MAVEGATDIIPRDHAVRELQRSHDDEEEHEGIEEFGALRRGADVVGGDCAGDLVEGG